MYVINCSKFVLTLFLILFASAFCSKPKAPEINEKGEAQRPEFGATDLSGDPKYKSKAEPGEWKDEADKN